MLQQSLILADLRRSSSISACCLNSSGSLRRREESEAKFQDAVRHNDRIIEQVAALLLCEHLQNMHFAGSQDAGFRS